MTGHGLFQNFWPDATISGGYHTGVGQPRYIHETQCGKTVEPRARHLPDDLPAVFRHSGLQPGNRARMVTPGRSPFGQHPVQPNSHLVNQHNARSIGKSLQRTGIHQVITFPPASCPAGRVCHLIMVRDLCLRGSVLFLPRRFLIQLLLGLYTAVRTRTQP